MSDALRARLEAIPKAELHVHLRGAVPLDVLACLMAKYRVETVAERRLVGRLDQFVRSQPNLQPYLVTPPTPWAPETLRPMFQYVDFRGFLATYVFTGLFFNEADDLDLLLDGVTAELARQRIVYAEITVSAPNYVAQGIPWATVLDCLERGAARAPLQAAWLIDPIRDLGPEAALALVEQLADRPASVIGITIGGNETAHPPAPFATAYRRAAELGLRRSVHAGEGLGPGSVQAALDLLGAERIGHGVRASEDPALVARLVAEQVPLEVSPTSNLMTGIYLDYATHPVADLIEAGVPVSINTDDPTFFATTLVDELLQVARCGVGGQALRAVVGNGFRHAFLDDAARQRYLAELSASWPAPADC